MKKRILIVVNKNWECEPFMEAFKKYTSASPVVDLSLRQSDNYMSSCRSEYHLKNYDVLIRCIQDLMDPDKGKSNSEEKYRVLPGYVAADKPDFVISVSTAESTPEGKDNLNGCVVFGGQYFMFDAKNYDSSSQSNLAVPSTMCTYEYDKELFKLLDEDLSKTAGANFKVPENNPADVMRIEAASNYACVGVVNVEDYKAYGKADPAAYSAYPKNHEDYPPMSIETTHGIVRMSTPKEISVIFVSPIVDRYHKFAEDVKEHQNEFCSYNAGVAVAEYIKRIDEKQVL